MTTPGNRVLPTKKKAKEMLWKMGNLQWKYDNTQIELRNFVLNNDNSQVFVFECSRRLGKSRTMLTLAIEECLKTPNYKVNYVAPTAAMLKNFLFPMAEEILEDCPSAIRPLISLNQSTIKFKNGSEIKLSGTDNKRADKLRGRASNLCVVDEAGFCDDLGYVVDSILLPTTLTTSGKIVLISTPPASMDHPFIEYVKKAKFFKRHILKTIYDNPRLTPEQIKNAADAAGGVDSNQFRREYLCEHLADVTNVVVPEFTKEKQKEIVREALYPSVFDAYVAMDVGGTDFTGILFALYDFQNAKIYIVDELLLKGAVTSDEIALKIKNKERDRFNYQPPYLRVSDNNNVILLNDLNIKHGMNFVPTSKDEKLAALNNMRLMLKDNMIIIHPRCEALIFQLANATWKGTSKTFNRTKDHGHYDLLDSLSIMCRNIHLTRNPSPPGQLSYNQWQNTAKSPETLTDFDHQLKGLFKINRNKNRRF